MKAELPIQIVCCIDNNFVMQYMSMIVSMRINNPHDVFFIHLFGNNLKEDVVSSVMSFTQSQNMEIKVYDIDVSHLSDSFPQMDNHISLATYMRCFVADYLPANLNKILYLDCDILVLSRLRSLWEEDLGEASVLCVEDMWALHENNPERLGYPMSYSYFNAGVLVINLDFWRSHNITQKSLQFLSLRSEILTFHDQDILNYLLHDTKRFVCPKYNMQDGFYRRRRKYMRKVLANEADLWLWNPVIVHFTGGKKPWHYKSYHPLKSVYRTYLEKTPFKTYKPKARFSEVVEVCINRFLWKCNIVKDKYRRPKNHEIIEKMNKI